MAYNQRLADRIRGIVGEDPGLTERKMFGGIAFMLNAASFFGVIFFLYHWKRQSYEHVETGRVRDAMIAGLLIIGTAPSSGLRTEWPAG